MSTEQQYFYGLEKKDLWLLAETMVILLAALSVLYFVKKIIIPMAFKQLGNLASTPPANNISYRQLLYRLPLTALLLWGIHWIAKTYMDETAAQSILFGGLSVIIFLPGHVFFHRTLKPFWHTLPTNFTIHFSSSAPGYQPLRKPRFRHRLDIAGLVILIIAGIVLIQRTTGWINPQQLIFAGLPIADYVREIHSLGLQIATKQKILNLAELIVMGVLYALMVLPFFNWIMRLIPSFNIKLTFIDHFGLLVACTLGIALGYLPVFLST